jgi:hypothetical protein
MIEEENPVVIDALLVKISLLEAKARFRESDLKEARKGEDYYKKLYDEERANNQKTTEKIDTVFEKILEAIGVEDYQW